MKAHPTAIIHPRAQLACSVAVGPYTVIQEGVELGDDCEVMSHVVLGGPARIGERPMSVYGANRVGLERRGISKEDIDELQAAFRLLSRSKLNTTQALEAIEARGIKSEHVRALVQFIKTSERGVAK